MKKSELIEAIAVDADVSKAAAAKMIDSLVSRIRGSLRKGNPVAITNLGTFEAVKRAPREVRNPGTGETIKIKARRYAKFRPSKNLNQAL